MDRCGKSTLISDLRKAYFVRPKTLVHHSISPPYDLLDPSEWEYKHYDELFSTAKMLKGGWGWDVIFDRFHLGAIVYGEKFRGSTGSDKIRKLDEQYLSSDQDAALILLTDDVKQISNRDDGANLEKNLNDLTDTKERFIKAFNDSKCINKIHIDVTENKGIDKTLPTVIQFLDDIGARPYANNS